MLIKKSAFYILSYFYLLISTLYWMVSPKKFIYSSLLKCRAIDPYIYDVHLEGGWGSLEICHLFADSVFYTIDLLFNFHGWRMGSKLVIFVDVINVWQNNSKQPKTNVSFYLCSREWMHHSTNIFSHSSHVQWSGA